MHIFFQIRSNFSSILKEVTSVYASIVFGSRKSLKPSMKAVIKVYKIKYRPNTYIIKRPHETLEILHDVESIFVTEVKYLHNTNMNETNIWDLLKLALSSIKQV